MTAEFPKMLYRPGSQIEIDGEQLDYLVVSSAEDEAAAIASGWKGDVVGPLDQSVKALTAYLASVTDPAEIKKLIADEKAGKTRASALAALNSRLEEL